MKDEKGIALIIVITLLTLFMVSQAYLLRFVFSDYRMTVSEVKRTKAFYAAEAGIEWGKTKLNSNPSWFTDVPHNSSNDKTWLLKDASGFIFSIRDVSCKVVKEEGKNFLYSIGYLGDNIEKSSAISIIGIEFSNPPFKQLSWEEI